MRFTIGREKLQEGLAAVTASIPTKTTLPGLANIMVETTDKGIRLSGTDLDIAVSTEVAADVEAPGAITIPARKLAEIARELPAAPVKVSAAGEQRITLECSRSRFKLLGPPKALEQIRRLFPPEEELEIARGDNHLGFRSPFTAVFTRLIEGPYPNYEQVIPKDNDRVALADKNGLAQALRRMSVIASDQTHRIRLSFNAGMVKLAVQTPDLGEAQDEVPLTYQGDPLDIGFNANYLLEILRYIPTSDVRL